tara:strand:+ start:7155 stop:7406 length:252 start_codon:yes stop_codon:yes gene_type:complete
MLGPRILLTSVVAGVVVSAASVAEVVQDVHFRFKARRQAGNGTALAFNGPYSTSGRDIVDSKGEKVTWAGVNWPMSGMSTSYI